MPKKTRYHVEVAFNDATPLPLELSLFLEALRYMGHVKPGPSNYAGVLRTVMIAPPPHVMNAYSQNWAETNAMRINTFGKHINAMVIEVQGP